MNPRLLLVSHTYTVPHLRVKLRAVRDLLQAEGGSLLALVPSSLQEAWGVIRADITPEEAAYVRSWPAWPPHRNSLRLFLPGWTRILDQFRPTHVHIEEEPFSLISLQVARAAWCRKAAFTFFSWENLERPLDPIRRLAESYVCWRAEHALAGNQGARQRLARRLPEIGISIVPQIGIDRPHEHREQSRSGPLKVIYVGRLVEEKGVLDLVEASLGCPGLETTFLGTGPLDGRLDEAQRRGAPIRLLGSVPHAGVREHILRHDVLVLPSRPHPRWTEQFGHVLIEAMAVGVVPVGSDSGAIPEVIGDPSLIFRHGDAGDLARVLGELRDDPARRGRLASHFRTLAHNRFSHEKVARDTLAELGVQPARPTTRVLMVADSPCEQWESMDIYASEVSRQLRDGSGPRADLLRPPGPPPGNQTLRKLRVILDRYWLLPRALRRRRAPIVHILDQSYAHLIRWSRPSKVVITCADLTPLELPRVSASWLLYSAAVRQIKAADHVVAISRATAEQLVRRLGVRWERLTVLAHGLDEAFFRQPWRGPGGAVRILHVGTNADYKRVWLVEEVAVALGARRPGVELWKVGRPLPARSQQRLAAAGVSLRNFERVSDTQLIQIYAEATFLVFPSVHEGFGRPVAEAMAVGLPVVASAIDSLREVSGGHAIHLEGADPGSYVEAMEALLANPRRLLDLSRQGRAWATRFRWEVHAQGLREIYEKLSGERPGLTSGVIAQPSKKAARMRGS